MHAIERTETNKNSHHNLCTDDTTFKSLKVLKSTVISCGIGTSLSIPSSKINVEEFKQVISDSGDISFDAIKFSTSLSGVFPNWSKSH